MQVVAVDIIEQLPESEAGNPYIFVVGDYFTKWVEAYAILIQEARTVAVKLVMSSIVDLDHLNGSEKTVCVQADPHEVWSNFPN